MKKLTLYICLLSFVVLFVGYAEGQSSRRKRTKPKTSKVLRSGNETGCKESSRSMIGNKVIAIHYSCPPVINNLSLSKTEIFSYWNEELKRVEVVVDATDPEFEIITYNYEVTGGKIIGKGAKVIWDLSGIDIGTYKITVNVDDGCGFCGKPLSKIITIKN